MYEKSYVRFFLPQLLHIQIFCSNFASKFETYGNARFGENIRQLEDPRGVG